VSLENTGLSCTNRSASYLNVVDLTNTYYCNKPLTYFVIGVSANNVDFFKNRLDSFWANQELICNYKNTLTGTGSTSFVDSVDDTIL